jgi:hypothetical protein
MTPEPTPVAGTENGDIPRTDRPLDVIVTTEGRAAATTAVMSVGSERVAATTAFAVGTAEEGCEPPRATERRAVVEAEARTADRRHAASTGLMPRPPERRGDDATAGLEGLAGAQAAPGADAASGVGGSAIACHDVCAGAAGWESVGVVSKGFMSRLLGSGVSGSRRRVVVTSMEAPGPERNVRIRLESERARLVFGLARR